MRELFIMFLPEYTITSKTLKNIGTTEYSKAIIDNAAILPSWEDNLKKEAKIITVHTLCQLNGLNVSIDAIKKYTDNLSFLIPQEAKNLAGAYDLADEIAQKNDLEETDIKNLHKSLTDYILPKNKQGVYRAIKYSEKPNPDELLAKFTEIFDWYNSLDAKETHPVIKTAILRGCFETLQPFESFNDMTADLCSIVSLKINGYNFKDFSCHTDYYFKNQKGFEQSLSSLAGNDPDFTKWIEYFAETIGYTSIGIKDKVILLEKDAKISRVSGRNILTERQERIVTYLQDYGMIHNKDFPALFPNISEDTVLRELKGLIDSEIIVKRGKTKSSRYELK